jgi:hypothetical protein
MAGTSIALFMTHKRSRAKKLREIRAYFREQTSYRNSIISMHAHAKSRLSMYSPVPTARHSRVDSLAQFGPSSTRESFDEGESGNQRLLSDGPSDEHPEHQQDSDDEGVGFTHHAQGNRGAGAPKGRWNRYDWGARK